MYSPSLVQQAQNKELAGQVLVAFALGRYFTDPISKKPITKRADGVAQVGRTCA
jgi:hypothetical protein